MARGESTRKLQLPDLLSMELLNEDPTPCIAAMINIDQRKISQFGRIKYDGFIRHRIVQICSVRGARVLSLPEVSHRRNGVFVHDVKVELVRHAFDRWKYRTVSKLEV